MLSREGRDGLVRFSFINIEYWTKLFQFQHDDLIGLNLGRRRETSKNWRSS